MKKLILIIALSPMILNAQVIATTQDGKRVVLNDDGTWIYAPVEKVDPGDCSTLTTEETDKMTGKTSKYLSETLVVSKDNKNGLGISLVKTAQTLIFVTRAVGAGSCINDDNKMNLLFRDGSRMEVTNMGKFNCKANFTLYLGGEFRTKKELAELQAKEIATMRIWTSDGFVEEDFTPEQSAIFKAAVGCLTN